MRKLLPALLSFMLFTLLLGSCGKHSYENSSILILADSLMQTYPDSALQLLEEISVPQKMGKANRAWYALLLTQARYKNYVPLKDDSLIRTAVDNYENGRSKERLAKSYFYWGCVYRGQEDIPSAIDCYLKSLRIMPQECDSVFLAMTYNHLGDCYNERSMEETARGMYRDAYAINLDVHDTLRAFHNLRGIGITFLLELQFDSAAYYYKQALEMALSLDYPVLSGIIYKDLSGVYSEQREYELAYAYISKAISGLSDIESLASAYSMKGDVLYNMNMKDSALYYWRLSKESPDIYTKTSNYYNIYRVNKELSDWENAVLYADSFIVCYDSIQAMNDRAEIDKLMDDHLLELHKYELSVEQKRTTNLLLVSFLFFVLGLIFLFMWRDRHRKNRYITLQKQLMDNRAETLSLNEQEICGEDKNNKLHELKEAKAGICISLFKSTEGYKRLDELQKAKPKERTKIIKNYRKLIIIDIKRTFVDVMEDLSGSCSSLTADDLLYCILILLHCPKEIVMDVMNVTSDAIKTRKSRIKNKMDKELFDDIFGD